MNGVAIRMDIFLQTNLEKFFERFLTGQTVDRVILVVSVDVLQEQYIIKLGIITMCFTI